MIILVKLQNHREVINNPKHIDEFNKKINDSFVEFINKDYEHINPLLKENILAEILEIV